MALPGYIFGGDTQITPEMLARNRKIAEALLAEANGSPRNVGEGFNAIGKALLYRSQKGKVDKGEAYARDQQKGIWGSLGDAFKAPMGAGAGFGTATGPIADASPAPSGVASLPTGERAAYIRDGLTKRGLPEHVADAFVVNFQDESGLDPGINERNPTVPGSRGGFGLYQLTGPRRKQYEAFAGQRGVDPSDTDAQLDFMMSELQGSEKRAGERILSAPDTASAAQAIVNDFLRPAPEHRNARTARYAGLGGGQKPVEVASLDPSAGVAEATAPVGGNVLAPRGSMDPETQALYDANIRGRGPQPNPANVRSYAGPGATMSDPAARMTDLPPGGVPSPQAMPPQGGAVMDDPSRMKGMAVARALAVPGQDQPQEISPVAAALSRVPTPAARPEPDQWAGLRETAAMPQPMPSAPPPRAQVQVAQAGGYDPQMLLGIMSNPWASDEQRQVAAGLLEQQQRAQTTAAEQAYDRSKTVDQRAYEDRVRRETFGREDRRDAVDDRREDTRLGLDVRKFEREASAPIEVNGRLVDPRTNKVVGDFSDRQTTTVNGVVVDTQTGQPIYEGPRDPISLPQGNVLFTPDGRRLADNPKPPEPGKGFEPEQNLRKEYTAAPEVKEYADVRSSYERLRASAQTGSGPGDLGVIFGYMKMLDPGSVVREGEFATAENSQGVPEYVSNMYNRLLTGERLTPDQRKSFVTAAGQLYGAVETKMRGVNQRFETIAGQYGIDPTRVIQPLPTYEPLTFADEKPAAPATPPASAPAAARPNIVPGSDAAPAQPQQAPAGVPAGIDPEDWKFMSDEDKALFR